MAQTPHYFVKVFAVVHMAEAQPLAAGMLPHAVVEEGEVVLLREEVYYEA